MEQSTYQEIVITDHPLLGHTLYLAGQLQTATGDEHQYHEMLVHVAMMTHPDPQRVLISGGGDGAPWRRCSSIHQ